MSTYLNRFIPPRPLIQVQNLVYTNPNSSPDTETQDTDPDQLATPDLIDELFAIAISALDHLSITRPSDSPKLAVQRNAAWWSANISVFRLEYTRVQYGTSAEEVIEQGDGKLYGTIFYYLAEAIFHACRFTPVRYDITVKE